ncbi:MFS general substrate transporter, partial [Clavulina sp. PMI_390]
PADYGFHAWMFVLSGFIIEFLVWGFAFCYGAFQEYFLTHPPFSTASEASINAVGTTALGLMYCLGYISIWVIKTYPTWVRTMMVVCLLASVASLFASSFATKVWHLILLQGVVSGTACGMLYPAVLFWIPEWFDKRRNLASAMLQAGSGVGGIVFPLLINSLLKRIGYPWTMRAFSLILLTCAIPVIFSIKPRYPLLLLNSSSLETPATGSDWKYLKSPLWVSINTTVFLQGLGHFTVSFYASTYTVSMGYSRSQGTMVLSIFNTAFVIASVLTGHWCDHHPYTIVMIATTTFGCALVLGLWGFATTLSRILAFYLTFGALSGSFLAVWTPSVTDVAGSNGSPIVTLMVFKGLAAVIGPIVAATLHPRRGGEDAICSRSSVLSSAWGACGFRSMMIFVGVAMGFASCLSFLVLFLRYRRNRTRL